MEQKAVVVTVENLTNSLGEIQIWVRAVRKALAGLDPKQQVQLAPKDLKEWTATPSSPLRTTRECPPPE